MPGLFRRSGPVQFTTAPAEPSAEDLARAADTLIAAIDDTLAAERVKAEPSFDRIDALLDRRLAARRASTPRRTS